MKLNELNPNLKNKPTKRVGRGAGSGLGKTSGKGHKVKKQDLVERFVLDLKVGKCQFNKDYLNLVLPLDHQNTKHISSLVI